jgi:hypothetical protein
MTISRQSAAKVLNTVEITEQEQSSTTIPRKGSTILNELEKAHVKFTSDYKTLPCLSGVYIIYCTISNKCYIGSSLNIKGRVIKHISYLKNKTHHSNKLQRAFDKYKLDSFSYGVLSITDDLRNQEERFIKLFNSYENGYNCTDKCINSKSFKLTKPQIEKAIVKSQKKVVALNFEGEVMYKFNSVSEASRFFKTSSSNISRVCLGKLNYIKDHIFKYESDYNENLDNSYKHIKRVFTEKHRNKISKALKGKPKTKIQLITLIKRCSKKVIVLKDSIIVNKFSSMKECQLFYKLENKALRKLILTKTPLGGLYFEFYEDIV